MKKAKFKVGDWVTIIGTGRTYAKAHILEVTTQLCEAGIEQISYLCRPYSDIPPKGWAAHSQEMRFREMELEKYLK